MQVFRYSDDDLTRQMWTFQAFTPFRFKGEVNLVVDKYCIQRRKTKRHQFREDASERYDAFDQRSYHSGIKASEVPLPEDVIDEVRFAVRVNVHPAGVDKRSLS